MFSILHYLSVTIAALSFVSAYPLAPNIGPYGVHFYNNNSQTMHISADWAEKDVQAYGSQVTWDYSPISPGGHIFIPGFPTTSPKFFIGLTPNQKTAEIGDKRNHDTAVEITFKGGHDWTYYDVDIEKGFSSPVWCHGEGEEWETGQGCTADLLAQCPEQDRHFDEETGLYDQCVAAETEDNLGLRLSLCPDVYVRYDDHKTKTSNGKNTLVCTITETAPVSDDFRRHRKVATKSGMVTTHEATAPDGHTYIETDVYAPDKKHGKDSDHH